MLSARILYFAAILTIVQGGAVQSFARNEPFSVQHTLAAFVYVLPYVVILAAVFWWIDKHRHRQEPRVIRWIYATGIAVAVQGALYAIVIAMTLPIPTIAILAIAIGCGAIADLLIRREWIWFAARELLPGLVVGLVLTHVADGIINLLIFDDAADRQRFLLFAAMNLGAIAGSFTMASLASKPHRLDPLLALLSVLGLVAISYQNRVALLSIPKLYAHMILGYFEWMCAIGAVGFSRLTYRAMGTPKRFEVANVVVGLFVLASVIALMIPHNPSAPVPRRLEPFTELLTQPLAMIADIDDDGFVPTWMGGRDCDEGNPNVHPLMREFEDGEDANCNGVAFKAAPKKTPNAFPTPNTDLTVLITIDQLRPDHMSVFGYEKETTPALNAAKDEFSVFENAFAPGGITTLSLPSYMAGRYVFSLDLVPIFRTTSYRYVNRGEEKPPERLDVPFASASGPWLLDRWKSQGRDVAVVIDDIGQHLARSVLDLSDAAEVISVPFDPKKPGRLEVTKHAIEKIGSMKSGGFLWLHYYDPHAAPRKCTRFERTKTAGCYDEAILAIDAELANVFSAMKDAGRWENSTIVVTSDHGEGFGEHGFAYHGVAPYEEFVRVPLMIKLPENEKLPTPARQVSVLDAIRTMARVAGLDTDQGHDLRDPNARSFPILTYFLMLDPFGSPFSQQTLLVRGNDRVVHDRVRGTTMVFDLSDDPEQRDPFYDQAKVDALFRAMEQVEAKTGDDIPKMRTIISKPRDFR